jgi:hypothetical protein
LNDFRGGLPSFQTNFTEKKGEDMRRTALFICGIAAMWAACTKEDISPGTGGNIYSGERYGDTIGFNLAGVWKLSLFDDQHEDLTPSYVSLTFLFAEDSTIQVLRNADTLTGYYYFTDGQMKNDLRLQFPSGNLLAALNGDYHLTVINDHRFKLEWKAAERNARYRCIEFRKQLGI